jgi:SAM-dependent methyltransferase
MVRDDAVPFRPETRAGGFPRDNGGIQFFTRVNALLSGEMRVLDLGAGRGTVFHAGVDSYYERLLRLQGKVKWVVGIDVDNGILDHPYLDERHVIEPSTPFPLESNSIDVVVSDWVLEHIGDPVQFSAEIARILKPGGWFCARTPNRWGYVGIFVRLVPNFLHEKLLKTLWPGRVSIDIFPTEYKLNSVRDLNRYFPTPAWRNCSYTFSSTPKYYGRSSALFLLFDFIQNIVPQKFKADLMVFIRKAE